MNSPETQNPGSTKSGGSVGPASSEDGPAAGPGASIHAELIEAVRLRREDTLKNMPPGPQRDAVAWIFDQEIAYLSQGGPEREARGEPFVTSPAPNLSELGTHEETIARAFMSRNLAKALFGVPGSQADAAEAPAAQMNTGEGTVRRPRRDLTGV